MTNYEFNSLEREHYNFLFDRYNEGFQTGDETKEYAIYWHDETTETEGVEFVEVETEEQAYERAEEMLGDEIPETAVIEKVVA